MPKGCPNLYPNAITLTEFQCMNFVEFSSLWAAIKRQKYLSGLKNKIVSSSMLLTGDMCAWGNRKVNRWNDGRGRILCSRESSKGQHGVLYPLERTRPNLLGPAQITAQSHSRFRHQTSTSFMMMSCLCEADLSAVAEVKSRCCAETCGPGNAGWCPSDSRRRGATPWPAPAKFWGQRCLSVRLVLFN